MTQPYSFPRTFTHTADTGHAKASAATRLRSNGLRVLEADFWPVVHSGNFTRYQILSIILLESAFQVFSAQLTAMYPYRVFISYSHSDRDIVERLEKVLKKARLMPMWDRNLPPGAGFSEQIQSFIVNSQIFLVILTKASLKREWLHQEIGYAVALGKPVLPVSIGDASAGIVMPSGIISGTQAIQIRPDLRDAGAICSEWFQSAVNNLLDRPAIYECTEDNARRATLLARYAESVSSLGYYGEVRQRASLGSFSLPDRGKDDPIWKVVFAGNPDDRVLFECLHRELVALRTHVMRCGCKLILDPVDRLKKVFHDHGIASVRARIAEFLAFLRNDSIPHIVVAINDDAQRNVSLTLVGDWFSSEAVSSGTKRVLREAVFTRHWPVVRQQVQDFENRLDDLLRAKRWTAETSRERTIKYLQGYLARIS